MCKMVYEISFPEVDSNLKHNKKSMWAAVYKKHSL